MWLHTRRDASHCVYCVCALTLLDMAASTSFLAELTPRSVSPTDLGMLRRFFDHEITQPGPARLVGPDEREQVLPTELYNLLVGIVEQLEAGNGVTVMPMAAELTTAEAAQILNVSRPHLIKQLEAEAIPFRMVGTHRRLRLQDVLDYRSRSDDQRQAALARLHALGKDFDVDD
jgi:excisionase family DNA binding protein